MASRPQKKTKSLTPKSAKKNNRKKSVSKLKQKSTIKLRPKSHKKRLKKPRKQYSNDQMKEALRLKAEGILTLRQITERTDVPRSSICDAIEDQAVNSGKVRKSGSPTVLTAAEEAVIHDKILEYAAKGYPLTQDFIIDNVKKHLDNLNKKTRFKDNRPGPKWFYRFMRDHADLAGRRAQNLILDRANIGEEELRDWFAEVGSHLQEKNLLDIGPERVFNCDELSIKLCPGSKKVITKKGVRTVYQISDQDEKECLTTLFTYNAAGTRAPPMIMFKFTDPKKEMPKNLVQSVPPGWGIGKSENGWITTESFMEYITSVFHPWLVNEGL